MHSELPCPGILTLICDCFDGKKFFPYLVFSGRVWPLFIYVWPNVAFELCMGLFWAFLSGLAVGGFEPLPLCSLYNGCLFELLCLEWV